MEVDAPSKDRIVAPEQSNLLQSLGFPALLFSSADTLVEMNAAATRLLEKLGFVDDVSYHSLDLQAFVECLTYGVTPSTAARRDSNPSQRMLPTEFVAYELEQSFSLKWSHPVQGEETLTLLLMIDLTERDQVQFRKQTLYESLVKTSRALSVGEMATVLAHELNQPLAAILNYLDVARRGVSTTSGTNTLPASRRERVLEALSLAAGQATQASAVIRRIRQFVRSSEPRKSPCSAEAIVERVLALLELEIRHHRVSFETFIEADTPRLLVDRVMIELVLTNLIRNAIDAVSQLAPGGRRIAIRVGRSGDDRVEIRVSDSGLGVRPEHRRRLFTPFFTTKGHGMGAGLPICRSIVEFHGGQLFLDDDQEDGDSGACFVCRLPTDYAAGTASQAISEDAR
ncbi:sensor histidine kinase [Allohahella sp. A8]|uniref:sensor histidine kinase n=1 Tax=Allohahella sp. A8 TaxID=3141461 RepID=UPI003A80309F